MTSTVGLKAVAVLEGSKGLLSLIVAIGLHFLVGDNLQELAESIVKHAHLNPASHLPNIFITAISDISNINISIIALGALAYSLIRFVEAYGLWKSYGWTKWFALLSGAVYLPFEVYGIIVRPSILGASIFALNIMVVAYMARVVLLKNELKQ
ncbi:DUF2127 domain-containing protein [Vibrio metschnikovii]|nr:DUF2127 domain-containing protein [Vibrio metschnikovii]EKO3793806.1 DUF2127 domain-containing protein [Vibrio metschnikovii]EKO3888600.1 DUF2127 domain-containing protein [Vibrio metschnikovii]EKO3937240.1 DUF2127 domain-containing protein [Vibrio metschnikovii]